MLFTKSNTLFLVFTLIVLGACKKENSTASGNNTTSVAVSTDACRPTQFINPGSDEEAYYFKYNTGKRVSEIMNGDFLEKYFYDNNGTLISIEKYYQDSLQTSLEYTYTDNRLNTEIEYYHRNGTKELSQTGVYVYNAKRLSRKNIYGVNNPQTVVSYTDYQLDAKDNIVSTTTYYKNLDSTYKKSDSKLYSYGTDLATKGMNLVLLDDVEFMNNTYLPLSISFVNYNTPSTQEVTITYGSKNAKGFPGTMNYSMSGKSISATINYDCN